MSKIKEILSNVKIDSGVIDQLRKTHYDVIVNGIRRMVEPLMDVFPNGLKCPFCYRYIDDDNEQSVYRIKNVSVEDGRVIILMDSNNGESWASDIHAGPEYDDDFENEQSWCASDNANPSFLDIEMVAQLYRELFNYVLPRLEPFPSQS